MWRAVGQIGEVKRFSLLTSSFLPQRKKKGGGEGNPTSNIKVVQIYYNLQGKTM